MNDVHRLFAECQCCGARWQLCRLPISLAQISNWSNRCPECQNAWANIVPGVTEPRFGDLDQVPEMVETALAACEFDPVPPAMEGCA